MDIDYSRIRELVERPGESLSVELKRWIGPDKTDGIAKIAKASLAMRNHGGGYIVIGFDNNTLEPDTNNVPNNVKELFHIDKIQGIVSRFASEPFEVSVEFPERDGQLYPIIVIPPGIKTPVASKSDLNDGSRNLVSVDAVYTRSLRANNTASTTKATWKDWPKIVEICFDNREADIGRFLRRHLSGLTPGVVGEIASSIMQRSEPKESLDDILRRYLQESKKRYESVIVERKLSLPEHGTWEVGLLFLEAVPEHSANTNFLNLLDSSNPDYTGWPVWLDSRGFRDEKSRPYVFDGVWEAMIVSMKSGWSDQIDFLRLDPNGKFHLKRALQDDVSRSPQVPSPLTGLDFGLPVIRSAEAIAVGIAFAKAMGCDQEKTDLAFAFRWTKLRGRKLVSWSNPGRYISPGRSAYQDEVFTHIRVPLDTPLSALSDFVNIAVKPLFEIFDGFVLGKDVVEDLTRRLIERKL
jgi:hypothetical protein